MTVAGTSVAIVEVVGNGWILGLLTVKAEDSLCNWTCEEDCEYVGLNT